MQGGADGWLSGAGECRQLQRGPANPGVRRLHMRRICDVKAFGNVGQQSLKTVNDRLESDSASHLMSFVLSPDCPNNTQVHAHASSPVRCFLIACRFCY